MQKAYKPIKRSRQLAILSREHHDFLLFVWKIRQGMAFGTDAEKIAKYCNWFWNDHMKGHLDKEESTLPAILSAEHPMIAAMIRDHLAIKIKMQEVIADPSYRSLQRLAQIIYFHIRFEERVLFTHIERSIPPDRLEAFVGQLSVAQGGSSIWTDEFWIKTAPGRSLQSAFYADLSDREHTAAGSSCATEKNKDRA